MKSRALLIPLLIAIVALTASQTGHAQSPGPVATGIPGPTKLLTIEGTDITLVAGAGAALNSGHVTAFDRDGRSVVILSGLPSGPSAPNNDPSGPSALHLAGGRLYIAIGAGDSLIRGPMPGTELANPSPTSPIFSSILVLDVSQEGTAGGFALTPADRAQIAAGAEVRLTNAGGERADIRLVVDFPNYVPDPIPAVPNNVEASNPFAMTGSESQLDVADAGLNMIKHVDVHQGTWRTIATFPQQRNTLPTGAPMVDAVPTGIAGFEGDLYVSFLTGAPFGPGAASIVRVNRETGAFETVIPGLRMVTDLLVRRSGANVNFWVLEHNNGRLLRYDSPGGNPVVVATGLQNPAGMTWDVSGGNILVTEIFAGRIVRVAP